jgi:hypothetical protein
VAVEDKSPESESLFGALFVCRNNIFFLLSLGTSSRGQTNVSDYNVKHFEGKMDARTMPGRSGVKLADIQVLNLFLFDPMELTFNGIITIHNFSRTFSRLYCFTAHLILL